MAYTNLTLNDRLNNAFLKSLWLQRDFADFADFNPSKFTPQFIADFQAAYQAALVLPSDDTLSDIGTEKTIVVNQKMEAARNLYQRRIKYFLEEAFGDKIGILNSFGYNDYQNIRVSVAGMISFLTNLEVRCTQEQAKIEATGIGSTFLTDIQTTRNELVTAYADQQTFFGYQKDITRTRKMTFDQMDNFVKIVCKVGKILYENKNFAKYSDYIIYKTHDNSKTTTKTIAPNSEISILNTEAVADTSLQIENIGETDLIVYVNDEIKPDAVGHTVPLYTTTILTTNVLSEGGYGMFIVRNSNPKAGKLRVKIMDEVTEEA